MSPSDSGHMKRRPCKTNETEDEMHFLRKCPLFAKERELLDTKIYKLNKNFINLSDDNKFI
jgi:hypothetical protein